MSVISPSTICCWISLIWSAYFVPAGPILPGPIWLFIKIGLFIFLYIWLRATLPRFRFDQLMGLAWKLLLPLALLNIVVTALARAWRLGWF